MFIVKALVILITIQCHCLSYVQAAEWSQQKTISISVTISDSVYIPYDPWQSLAWTKVCASLAKQELMHFYMINPGTTQDLVVSQKATDSCLNDNLLQEKITNGTLLLSPE